MGSQKRSLDGLEVTHKIRKPHKKKITFWIWLAIFLVLGNLIFSGIVSANYLNKSADVLSLFRDGKFLILLQNNSELRSSGGFIGSYAVLDVNNFEVQSLNFNTNIYSTDRAFSENNHIDAPPALDKTLHGQTWALRDANYDASFPEAGKDILNFYEKETGEKADAVIGLNGKFIVDLLNITGPINLSKYNTTIDANNFYFETQSQIEQEYYKNPENWAINEPKTILKDLYPVLVGRALKEKLKVINAIAKNLRDKEIVLYFQDPIKEDIIQEKNWAGEIPSSLELKNMFLSRNYVDYLFICNNSYSANKSSLSVKQNINYNVIENNGMFLANLKITRKHTGSNEWPDGKNTNWLRAYVSEEAGFINATLNGQDVTSYIEQKKELDKKYFGLEIYTEPGQTSILEINYSLPKENKYNLLVQKQPGEIGDTLMVDYLGKILFDGTVNQDIKVTNR